MNLKINQKSYLITGGAGFIGSAIARSLVAKQHKVVVIDNLKTGKSENVPQEVDFYNCDIRDKASLNRITTEHSFDAVLHLAGQSSGEISFEDPVYDLETNALGTLHMLQFCEERGIKRFLNASSMAVYGNQTLSCVRESETIPYPLSFYATSKLAGEGYCRFFSPKMDITSFRLFSIYGPGQDLSNSKQGMVSIFLAELLHKRPVIVKGSPHRIRDFTFVDDVVEIWVRSIDNPMTFGKTLNLGTGVSTNVGTLLEVLSGAFQQSMEESQIIISGNTPGDQNGIYADLTNFKTCFPDFTFVDLKTGIKRFIETEREKI